MKLSISVFLSGQHHATLLPYLKCNCVCSITSVISVFYPPICARLKHGLDFWGVLTVYLCGRKTALMLALALIDFKMLHLLLIYSTLKIVVGLCLLKQFGTKHCLCYNLKI